MSLKFSIKNKYGKLARRGVIETPSGKLNTPAFVPVATKATVKGVSVDDLKELGAEAVLANTYHLFISPGEEIVKDAGGFPKFMNWDGVSFTDSGGFQVFSLGEAFGKSVSKVAKGEEKTVSARKNYSRKNKMCFIDEEGVDFKSYKNGDILRFTPEISMRVQYSLGADIIFAFDECTSPTADYDYQISAMERTHRWALRCLNSHGILDTNRKQSLFAVVQGGKFIELRRKSATELASMKSDDGEEFDGFGIGGSFSKDDLGNTLEETVLCLPEGKPRHLLGLSEPEDIFDGVRNGCDTFDCVSPTRLARHGVVYTRRGKINIKNGKYKNDYAPIENDCDCKTCSGYSRAYLRHLLKSGEVLGITLASIHNLRFMMKLMSEIRNSIEENRLEEFEREFMSEYLR